MSELNHILDPTKRLIIERFDDESDWYSVRCEDYTKIQWASLEGNEEDFDVIVREVREVLADTSNLPHHSISSRFAVIFDTVRWSLYSPRNSAGTNTIVTREHIEQLCASWDAIKAALAEQRKPSQEKHGDRIEVALSAARYALLSAQEGGFRTGCLTEAVRALEGALRCARDASSSESKETEK